MKRVQACPACGSPELQTPGLSDFAVPGAADVSGMRACRACGWRGFPVTVPAGKLAELQALAAERKTKRGREAKP